MKLLSPATMMDASNQTSSASYITEIVDHSQSQYEQLLADIWVGILLALILLSCICCTCTCLIYHKFQKWKRIVLHDFDGPDILTGEHNNSNYDCDSLPSYTVASGLPSYEEAIRQLESAKKLREASAYPPTLKTSPSRVSLMSCIHIVNEKT